MLLFLQMEAAQVQACLLPKPTFSIHQDHFTEKQSTQEKYGFMFFSKMTVWLHIWNPVKEFE